MCWVKSLDFDHISFDFSHALEYPHEAHERMDEYFMPKIRTHIFGIVNEGSGIQYNYMFHEPGKCDPNSVISMLHDFLENEIPTLGSADACSAQNRSNAMVNYLKHELLKANIRE